MRTILLISWLAMPLLAQESLELDGKALDEDTKQIAVLIEQLADEEFATRELAGRKLVAIGERALPAIRQAISNSEQAEQLFRAESVVRGIISECRTSKSTGLEMVMIKPGQLQMGSPEKETGRRDDELLHGARINNLFLLAAREVTQQQFQQVMKFNPSHFTIKSDGKEKVLGLDTNEFPVERVTWFDAIEFCNKLSRQDGYAAYYKTTNAQHNGASIKQADVVISGGNGYRLPTEAEWEYACRTSTKTRFHFGDRSSGRSANFISRSTTSYGSTLKHKSIGRTAKVGSYKPNTLGLYDMHGNVAEWCWDWYDKNYYAKSRVDDPHGPDRGDHRTLRGGSWLISESSCRSASRFYQSPKDSKYFAGFRVARTP